MIVLIVMFASTGTAVVIDRGLMWWRQTRWRRVARRSDAGQRRVRDRDGLD